MLRPRFRFTRFQNIACLAATAFVAVMSPNPTPLQGAELVTVGASLAASAVVVDDVIEKAGNEGNYVVFSAGSEMKLVIESARLALKDVVSDAVSKLDGAQYHIFANVQKSVQGLQTAVEQPIEQARQTVEGVQQILAQITFQEPAVLRTLPSVVGPASLTKVPFTVRGVKLDDADPQLYFDNKKIEGVGGTPAQRIGLTQQQATFSVPAAWLASDPLEPKLLSARLRLNVDDCAFFLFCKKVPRDYEVAILSLPKRVASLSLTYWTKTEERVYEDTPRKKDFGYSTGDLTRMKCTKEPQGPHAPGYFIDTDSISAAQTHGKARNRWERLDTKPTGFVMELCAQSQISKLKKKSGEITVNVTWREYKLADVVSPAKTHVNDEVFNWSGAYQEKLPPETHAVSLKLQYFDGTESTFIASDMDRYASVSWNNETKQLLVNAKQPKEINGIN